MTKETHRLKIGVVGCGPIAQFAHFDACRKARNAELYAICDVADDLVTAMAAIHKPSVTYTEYEQMLNDPLVDAIIIATSDPYHAPLSLQAIAAGKHVLVEKPLGTNIEECEDLRRRVKASGLVFQVGHNRRFDPGLAFVHRFLRHEVGQRMGLKYWYYDSIHRYTMTDNLLPQVVSSSRARRHADDPKANKQRYFLLTHGSHLVDSARYFGGEIAKVRARHLERFGAHCWFIDVDFADGTLGHLDMTIAIRGDFEEGFQVYGEHGSAAGKVFLPWYHKASVVECFSAKDRQFRRPLGEDSYTYKLQIEAFADTILHQSPQCGANIDDGVATMQAMVAIACSARTGESMPLTSMTGGIA